MKKWSLPRNLPDILLCSLAGLVILTSGQSLCGQQTQSREEEIRNLLEIAKDSSLRETNPNRAAGAIKRLGQMKAVETIDDLIGLLTFRIYEPWEKDPHQPILEMLTSGNRYPAVGALEEIGKAALPALLKAIETHESSSLETENAMEVLIYLSRGKQRSEYVDYLKEEAAKASSKEASERLLKAAEALTDSKR